MIFTECCYCDEPIIYPYESGFAGTGTYAKVECEKCGRNNFVELTSIGGETLSEEYFRELYPNANQNDSE